jgi:hypothetical protein
MSARKINEKGERNFAWNSVLVLRRLYFANKVIFQNHRHTEEG